MKIKNFNNFLLEREDLSHVKYLNSLYDLLKNSLYNQYKDKNLQPFHKNNQYVFYISNFITPFILVFDSNLNGLSGFGLSLRDKIPFISLPYENENDDIESFLKKLESLEPTIKHELTHFYDYLRSGIVHKPSYNLGVSNIDIVLKSLSYLNDTGEVNAYYIQAVCELVKKLDKDYNNWKFVLDDFKHFISFLYTGNWNRYQNLDEKNKKRIQNRAYLLYTSLKEKYKS
jgi:hypothetical protein